VVEAGSFGSSYREYGTLSDGREWEKVYFTAVARNDAWDVHWQQGYVDGFLDFPELSSIDANSVKVIVTNSTNYDHYQVKNISGNRIYINFYIKDKNAYSFLCSGYVYAEEPGYPKLEIAHNFPSQVTSGDTITVTVSVKNTGSADATNVASGISWSDDAFYSQGCTGTWKADRLKPGGSIQYTCTLRAGNPGTYTVEVAAVADGGVSAKSTFQVAIKEAPDTTPPRVRVLAPSGGESLVPGGTFRIRWEATDNVGVARVHIWLFQGSSQVAVIARDYPNTGYYDWTVPDRPGSGYVIRVAAVDAAGNAGSGDSGTFTITEKSPPKLTLFNPEVSGLTVTVNGVATPGYEGAKIDRLTWDWGDGSSENRWFPASHMYSKPGTYTITVTVYQSDGLTVTKTLSVYVEAENQPPVAGFSYSPSNPLAGDGVSFTDQSYDPDGSVVSWRWDFGDGASSSERNPTHVYYSPGSYTVTLTVKDDKGAEKSVSKTVYVGKREENKPPVAYIDLISPNPAYKGQAVTFKGHGYDYDGEVVECEWSVSGMLLSHECSFSASDLPAGKYTVYFRVKDDKGAWSDYATDTLTINVLPFPLEIVLSFAAINIVMLIIVFLITYKWKEERKRRELDEMIRKVDNFLKKLK
jgi:PKD repeat protein